MNLKNKLPFQNLNSKSWKNLAIVATITFYLIQVGIGALNLFSFLGFDFMSYWSAGYITNHGKFSQIYDFALLEKAQHLMIFGEVLPNVSFPPVPMPYIPIFILPFQALALLPPISSFYLWTFLNLLVGVPYLIYFTKKLKHPNKKQIISLFIISFPFFQNLFWGQTNFFLLIFLGEFIRAIQSKKEYTAGLWISALLLKPQTLIIIIPALLIGKKLKTLLGAALGAFMLLGTSFLIAGVDGTTKLIKLWLGYTDNIIKTGIEMMGNWRMIGSFIDLISPSGFGVTFAIVAATITILWALYLWKITTKPSETTFIILITATFAATGLATWHSHVHMAVILIPALLFLYLKDELPEKLASLWIFLPVLLHIIGLIFFSFTQDRLIRGLSFGLAQLILNLMLLIWTSRELLRRRKKEKTL